MKKATIHDVAALAGVSIKTVSRVVNNEAGLRDATRARVQAAIRQLAYAPNRAARGLAGSHSFQVGFLYQETNAAYVTAVLNGVTACCKEAGFDLLLHPCDFDHDLLAEITTLVREARLAGLVISAPLCDDKALMAALEREKVPFVKITAAIPEAGMSGVTCDDAEASAAMARHLLELGHRHIAVIKGHPDHTATDIRLCGFRSALQAAGVALPDEYIRQGDFWFASGRRCTAELLSLDKPPTAIFACNDEMAAGAIFEAQERGLSLPADLSIAGFDDAPLARMIWPSLTTIRQPIREMSVQATRLLIDNVKQRQPQAAQHLQIQAELIIRNSTAPP